MKQPTHGGSYQRLDDGTLLKADAAQVTPAQKPAKAKASKPAAASTTPED